MKKKNRISLRRAFGEDEYGELMLPRKMSGVRISRLFFGEWMGCSFCFPHGRDTINNRRKKPLRSWKGYRRTQWKS